MLEPLVEGLDAHRLHALRDQIPDRIVDHRRHDAGLQSEAVRQVGGDIEFTAADMDLILVRLAKRDDAGVQAMDQSAERHQVQGGHAQDLPKHVEQNPPVPEVLHLDGRIDPHRDRHLVRFA